jgi:hypothetical protein
MIVFSIWYPWSTAVCVWWYDRVGHRHYRENLRTFHLKLKTFWKIPKVHNVILWVQFPFLIQSHLVSSRIVKLDVLQEQVQLKEMHHLMMKCVPQLRQKNQTKGKPLLIFNLCFKFKYNSGIQWRRTNAELWRTEIL